LKRFSERERGKERRERWKKEKERVNAINGTTVTGRASPVLKMLEMEEEDDEVSDDEDEDHHGRMDTVRNVPRDLNNLAKKGGKRIDKRTVSTSSRHAERDCVGEGFR
jgi:hypothetical protein